MFFMVKVFFRDTFLSIKVQANPDAVAGGDPGAIQRSAPRYNRNPVGEDLGTGRI